MADQKDRQVAGRPEEPEPTGSAGADPVTAAEGTGRAPGAEAGAARREATAPEAAGSEPVAPEPVAPEPETDQPAAHHAVPPGPPPGPPPGGYHGAPPVPGGPGAPLSSGMRERVRSRPAQLLAAGIVGAIIGGGAVGLIDVLDDDGPGHARVHMVQYGRGHADADGFGHWHDRMHQDGPMTPDGPGWERWRGTRPWPAPSWAPDAPAPAPPSTPSAPSTP